MCRRSLDQPSTLQDLRGPSSQQNGLLSTPISGHVSTCTPQSTHTHPKQFLSSFALTFFFSLKGKYESGAPHTAIFRPLESYPRFGTKLIAAFSIAPSLIPVVKIGLSLARSLGSYYIFCFS